MVNPLKTSNFFQDFRFTISKYSNIIVLLKYEKQCKETLVICKLKQFHQ